MKIYLFLDDKILNFTLPREILGSFSFDENDDEDSKLINIEGRENKWILYSTDDVSVVNNNTVYSEIVITNNRFYILRRNSIDYLIYICTIENNTYNIYTYDNKLNLIIGNTQNCNLKYSTNYYNGLFASIICKDNSFILEHDDNISIYINDNILKSKQYILKYGDRIVIYSLKIIFLKNIILICNPFLENYLTNDSGLISQNSFFNEEQNLEIKDRNLYNKNNFFSKSPRIRRFIDEKELKILAPPALESNNNIPIMLTIAPMLTMALIPIFTFFNSIIKIISEEATIGEQLPSLVSTLAMFLSIFLWPLIMKHYTKKQKIKKAKENVKKYDNYLNSKKNEFIEEQKIQKEIIVENLISCEECVSIIQKKDFNLWDKRNDQDDFLLVRIGIGKTPLKVKIEIPNDSFSVEDNEFNKKIIDLVEQYKYIENVPVGYSLFENNLTAIMGNQAKSYGFVHNIILQLVTFYSYEDVKIVIFTSKENVDKWNCVKYLNHNFNDNRDIRFFATNLESGKVVSDFLSNELSARLDNKSDSFKPYYIVITDNCELIRNYKFFNDITESEVNLGFSCIMVENYLSKLPSKCNNFITLGVDNQSGILKNLYERQEQINFNDEVNYNIDMNSISKILSNIPIDIENKINHLQDTISFLEMEKIGKVEQLNILNRWNINDSTTSLKAEVGYDEHEKLMYLDLHEKAHGPHGLVAGTTGSGKSEFIITYILSMCVNYSPDDVSFIIIDYKGGGLALALENKSAGLILPHLAGIITNLDKAEMDRTLVSIDSEIKRRQKMFNNARDILGESTMDIYKYQQFYHDKKLNEAIPHLFIICDEFAELKMQQPEFMDNLISVARIGRSLGVHLILATQKPTGVVNDQIWSNSRFKVCLKVQDESDSREMLKNNDAAYLKQAGRFYLQVGFDEYYALGQTGWCGAKYYPSDKYIKQIDKSVSIINDCGSVVKNIPSFNIEKKMPHGDQLTAILTEIINASKKVNKVSKRLWLDNIPDTILIDDLYKKYNIDNTSIKAVIGEYDAPEKQEQGIVEYDFLEDGNTIIYGNDGSERELLINAIIYSTITHYSSEYINFYAIDYGSEILNRYLNSNHFGGVVTSGEDEEFNNLFKFIKKNIAYRKKIFSNYGIDFKNYNNSQNKKLPLMVVIINNYDSVYESNQNIYELLPNLIRDSERYGIIFILSCNSITSIHNKIAVNCRNFYSFKLKESSDYVSIFGNKNKILLRDVFGRGLINNNGIHEFQTAKIIDNSNNLNSYLSNVIESVNLRYPLKAPRIPLLPDFVRFNTINSQEFDLTNIPIGISKNNLDIIRYNFTNNVGNIISSNKLENTRTFVRSLLCVLQKVKKLNVYIMDASGILDLNNNLFSNYYVENLDDIINKLIDFIQKLYINKADVAGVVIIYGLNKFINIIKKDKLTNLIELLKVYKKFNLIIVDDANEVKSYSFDSWFTNSLNLQNGIWIGNGISTQNLFRLSSINKTMISELKNDMGYFINDGNATLCRFIDFFTKDDENGE